MRLAASRTLTVVCCLAGVLGASSAARAIDPERAPVAVRWWGQAFITIETWWGLTVAIDPYSPARTGYSDPGVAADLVLVSHDHADHNNAAMVRGNPFVVRGLDDRGDARSLDLTLDRLPNENAVTLAETEGAGRLGPHAVRVVSIPAWHDNHHGAKRGATALFLIETDGVRILHCGDLGQRELTPDQLEAIGRVDVLLIPVGGTYTIDGADAARITDQVAPRFVVPIHFKTPVLSIPLADASAFREALPDAYEERGAVGNTLAVAAFGGPGEETTPGPVVVTLGTTPWTPSPVIHDGLARIARAREALARTLESLTPTQLDHHPANGTHTVRWNAEHTAGAEAIFISLVLHDADPTLPLMRISPAQQPKDYVPANPDWSPTEEAMHIRRVGALTERFAYLLDGVDPAEERYPAFFKSLNGLFDLLENHYDHHHEQVKKKFEEPDWPAE